MTATSDIITGNLRHQASRFVAPALGVVVGVVFVTTALVLGASLAGSIFRSLSGDYGSYAAVVTPSKGNSSGTVPAALVTQLDGVPGVRAAIPVATGNLRNDATGSYLQAASVPLATSKAWLAEGRYPNTTGEIAVSLVAAQDQSLRIGSRVNLVSTAADVDRSVAADSRRSAVTVVGLVDAGRDVRYGPSMPIGFGTTAAVLTWTGSTGYSEILVSAEPGTNPAGLVRQLNSVLPSEVQARTGAAHAQVVADESMQGGEILSGVLLGFAAIAVFVSMLVIANTFAILLARRSRETALLRCVGATRGQVVLSALAEAMALGVVASVVGVAVGIALSGAAVAVIGHTGALGEMALHVPAHAIGVPLLEGILSTVAAALWPVLRSTRVAPLAALRPVPPVAASRRAGQLRAVTGALAVLTGAGLLALGVASNQLVAGIAGGAVSFTGVVMVGPVLIPWLMRVVAWPARILSRRSAAGVPVDLAVENSVRSPGRAAATTNALLVGVTLVIMTLVGGATTRASLEQYLNQHFPVDVAVSATPGHPLPNETTAKLRAVDGVAAAAPVSGISIRLAGSSSSPVEAVVMDDVAREVIRDSARAAQVRPGSVVTTAEGAHRLGLQAGQRVSVQGDDGSRQLQVVVSPDLGYSLAISGEDAAALDRTPVLQAVWLRLADDADVTAVMNELRRTAPDASSLDGAAPEREQLNSVLNTTTSVVTGLLAISVLIALIGVANTLSLSAIERSGESALLRALGLTRTQLRGCLGIEGVLLALIGAIVGLGLGVLYGWTGSRTLIGAEGVPTLLEIPWLPIGGVLLATLLAGLLASVLPARRAVRLAPAQLLAAD